MTRYQGITRARVLLRNQVVGELEKCSSQLFTFTYNEEYVNQNAIPIAHCFPVKRESYESKDLHSYFDNMILEGWLLERAERELHIDKKNRFALLMAVGRDPIGAVSVRAVDSRGDEVAPSGEDSSETQNVAMEDDPKFKINKICPACLVNSPQSSLYHGACRQALWGSSKQLKIRLDQEDPLASFSRTIHGGGISGAQRKGLFALDEKKKELNPKVGNAQYILKPNGDFPELPANEHLTMAIAKRSGFQTPPFGIVSIEKLGLVYVIKRFDWVGGQKRLVEDMAQITGEMTDDKYDGSYEKIAAALGRYSEAPKLDRSELFRRIVFCLLTANGDMHLKNWMLLESEDLDGKYALAPCYDFLNTRIAIPKEKMDSALPLNGRQNKLTWKHLEEFALGRLSLEPKFVKGVREEVAKWSEAAKELIPHSLLSNSLKEKYLEIVEERQRSLDGLYTWVDTKI